MNLFVDNIPFARSMAVSPSGTLFVASYSFVGISGETKSMTYVYAVRDDDHDGVAEFISPVTEELWVW